jgi:hypothetical protein
MMKVVFFLLIAVNTVLAVDVTTLDGRIFRDVHDISVRGDRVTFATETSIQRIFIAELPPDVRERCLALEAERNQRIARELASAPAAPVAPPVVAVASAATPAARVNIDFDKFIVAAREAKQFTPSMSGAYRISDLREAKARAARDGKPLGFILAREPFFDQPAKPMGKGSVPALAHFLLVFEKPLVIVFIRDEKDELEKLPDAVRDGFSSPDAGEFDPKLVVTDAAAEHMLCVVPMGGPSATGSSREAIFRQAMQRIRAYYEDGTKR